MSKFTKELVNKYADDLLIGLTNEENKIVLEEFEIIEENMNLINEIEDIEKIEPMTHPFDLYLAKLDKDEAVSSIDKKIALRNSDMSNNDAIVVPRVVG